ncbi:wings apart-like protein homolog [Haliotis rufescens]|uniref:wings apart-like protein homolog n=1 Tax=Haliotis rufescens TaxID=6454 RepID=UPI00201E9C04|nr:wings apart-like protein homolog [Haliotis rufescens]
MSSSTAQRFGAKTYSRSKESTASRAFDEIVTTKPALKAAPSHTKWGKTNFKALRESQRLKMESSQAKKPRLEEEPKGPEDPFSFDTDMERKRSPVKKQVVLAKASTAPSPRLPGTRLPGTRIATRGAANEQPPSANDNRKMKDESVEVKEEGDFSFKSAVTISKRTYTRTPFANPVETKKKLVTEVIETKPVVNFGFGDDEDEYKPQSSGESPHSINEDDSEEDDDEDDDEVSFNFKMPQFMKKEARNTEELSDDDVSSVSFKKQPVRTYGSNKQTSNSETSQLNTNQPSPPTATTLPTAITRGPHSPRRASRYSDPKLLQEYKRMYVEKTGGKNQDAIGSFSNSTVISKAQVKGQKGTTLIVVCKPKGVEQETKETVQHKYFGNPSKALGKADRPIKIDVITEGDEEEEEETSDADAAKTSTYQFDNDSSDESNQWSSQPITYNSRTHAARAHNNSVSTVQVRNKIYRSSHVDFSSSSSSEPVPASSQDSIESEPSLAPSTDSNSNNDYDDRKVKERKPVTYSSRRSYRIFKSRAPPPEVKQEIKEEIKQELSEEVEPPSLDIEPPTLEPAQIIDSPQVSPPCLSVEPEEEEEEEKEEEEDEDKFVPMDTTPSSSQEYQLPDPAASRASNAKSSATSVFEDFDLESDSQSVVSEESHDSQDDSQGSGSQQSQVPETRRIFKSKNSRSVKKSSDSLRRKVLQSPKKSPTKAVYNPRSWQGSLDQGNPASKEERQPPPTVNVKALKGFAEPEPKPKSAPKLTRAVHWPSRAGDEAYTSIRVNKEHRPLFTVVRNVKQAFEVQESGETQDFMDDVEYLLDGLQDSEPMPIRCLSCIQLAGKCTLPAFRMHLRAHGTMTKIFTMLHDANTNPSLALSTATMMYMLSKDRLNMDLDQESLDLMLRLLEVDSEKNGEVQLGQADLKELERTRQRVYELCEQMQNVGTKMDLDTISTGNLAMESLLSLTSRKAGEWFKEELRSQGALDHIVNTVNTCSQYVGHEIVSNDKSLPNLRKLDRCLRVLENITYMNTDNQSYVISYENALLITSICRVLQACEDSMPMYPVTEDPEKNKMVKETLGYTIISCVLAILRVLLNVTHDNEFGSTKVGEQEGLMECVLLCVFSTTQYAPADQKFDILVLCIGLLINMVEHCLVNRRHLIENQIQLSSGKVSAVKALIQLFCEREKAAREMEEQQKDESTSSTDQPSLNTSGEWQESEAGVQWIVASAEKLRKQQNSEPDPSKSESQEEPSVLDDEETFTQALHKAGKHMENSIIASYVALLIGCLIQDNRMYVDRVKEYLPDGSFDSMIKVLKKFLGFMNLTSAIGNTGGQPIARVIEILEAC